MTMVGKLVMCCVCACYCSYQDALPTEFSWWYSWVCRLDPKGPYASFHYLRNLAESLTELVQRDFIPLSDLACIGKNVEAPTEPERQFLRYLHEVRGMGK
jgi:hypothetical protein